jgi:AraC-like DNA-binding protein
LTDLKPNSSRGSATAPQRGTVFAPLVGMLWRTLEFYGIPPQEVIPREIYRPGAGSGAPRRISLADYFRLLVQVAERVEDPAVGLRSAEMLHPSHLGALGHAFMASTTLREAIERGARYNRMLSENVRMETAEEAGNLKVSYVSDGASMVSEPQADAQLASLLSLCRLNFGRRLKPLAVRMRRASPEDPAPWTEVFGVPVEFGAEENCLVLRRQDVDEELTVANPALAALHEDVVRRHLAIVDREDVVNRARVAIMELLPSGELSEELVAERLGMTPRTLYSRLKERDVPFRTLLSELRRELAERYLADPSYSMTEIAFLLGYSESSGFSRAFKGWHGVTPSEYRASKADTR